VPQHAAADGNEHPVVYAAKEGHGSYWREDCNFSVTWAAPGVSPLTSDACADGPDDWETWKSTVDATEQPWYGYGGAWGDVGPGVPGLASDTVGPPGPGAANGLAPSEPEIENVVLEQIHDDGLFRWDDRLKTWVMSLDDRVKDNAGDLIGWLAGGVDISLFSTRIALGQLTATADGSLEGSLALPRNVTPGVHTLVLSGWHPSAQYMQEVRVLVEVPRPPVTPKPPTPKPPAPKPPTPKPPALPTGTGGGYWLLERDGDIAAYGAAAAYETAKPNLAAGASAVALAARPDGKGLWVLTSDGDIVARGAATDFGRVDLAQLAKPGERVATMSATPTGTGLWVFTTAGRILSFGDALPADEMTGSAEILALDLDGPIIHSAATPTGRGAYLVASDGGVFTVGDARFIDSVRGQLSKLFGPPGMPDLPVVGITPDPDGDGYWMVAADGGVFSFRTPFRGSLPAVVPFDRLAAPVNGMVPYGNGYLLVAGDGGVFTFSNEPFQGSGAGNLDSPVVGIASA
jgi:hypothetical protein